MKRIVKMRKSIILLFAGVFLANFVFNLPSANAGLFGPDCKKVSPQVLVYKTKIIRLYEQMNSQKNKGFIVAAYTSYKSLNSEVNKLGALTNKDKNYRCLLDANYPQSTYNWKNTYPGMYFGGQLKNACKLWGYLCPIRPTAPINPCDEYTKTADYQDCIEDHARPTG